MTCVDIALLDGVVGGADAPNRTRVQTSDGQVYENARTDYGYCADVVDRNCQRANTSWLFGTNQNAAKDCTIAALPKACPPTLSGGPASSNPD